MKNITTDRLILRNFCLDDAEGILKHLKNPRVNCFVDGKIENKEKALVEVEKRSKNDSLIAVALKENNYVIGELFYEYEEPDTYSVGWHFNSEYEGKGDARESSKALFKYLFEGKNARRIYAYTQDNNYSSQRLCEALGMRKEGVFLEFISFVNNEDGTPKYENTFQYAILKKEWENIRKN